MAKRAAARNGRVLRETRNERARQLMADTYERACEILNDTKGLRAGQSGVIEALHALDMGIMGLRDKVKATPRAEYVGALPVQSRNVGKVFGVRDSDSRPATVLAFPVLCTHCNTVYWYEPAESMNMDPACREHVLAHRRDGKDDAGTAWWKALADSLRSSLERHAGQERELDRARIADLERALELTRAEGEGYRQDLLEARATIESVRRAAGSGT